MWRNTFLCLLIVAIFVMPIATVESKIKDSVKYNTSSVNISLNGGWLEDVDGVRILHLNGSYYDMGYQQGYLLKDEINQNFRAYISFLEQVGITYDDLLDLWGIMREYIPLIYTDELQGIADGSGLSFNDVAACLMIEVINHDISACSHAAAWGSATVDGKLYHVRSNDWSLGIVDPETGIYLQENQVLVVRQPDDGYASAYPLIAGQVTSHGGVNEQGISFSHTLSWCMADISNQGIPTPLREKMVLDHAATAQEAINIVNTNRTRGWTVIISDGKTPIAYAVELSANYSYIGTWDNPVESTSPFWEIDHVVRRGNFYIESLLASLQRKVYNPRSAFHWFIYARIARVFGLYDDYKYEYYPEVMLYRVLSEAIEDQWGNLTLNTSMSIIRDVYSGKTDAVWKRWQEIFGWYQGALRQWVICPETGDIVISFADADISAHENPVHYFNLYELLDAEPP